METCLADCIDAVDRQIPSAGSQRVTNARDVACDRQFSGGWFAAVALYDDGLGPPNTNAPVCGWSIVLSEI